MDQIAADQVKVPECNVTTGKKVAIVGGGPSGLTTAYYLSLMGHKVDVYEEREALGGMLRYGIPNYRLPKDRLDEDINAILSTGNITVHYNTAIGRDITMEQLKEQYNAIYIHTKRKHAKMCKKTAFLRLCGSEKRFSCKLYPKLLLIQMVDRNMQLSQQLLNVRTGGRHISC